MASRVYERETQAPKLQIFTSESLRGEDISKRFCVECGGYLVYWPHSGTYGCNSCGMSFTKENRDLLLSAPKQDIAPAASQVDTDDENVFFQSFGPDDQYEDSKNYEVISSLDSGRITHIRCKGIPSEALTLQRELDSDNDDAD